MFKKILITGVAAALIAGPVAPTYAQSDAETAVGAGAGAATGAAAGAVVGGPIGAIIGGFAGATLGASATVPDTVVKYTTAHPVQPTYLKSSVEVGQPVAQSVTLHPVPNNQQYAYFYANGRAYIVERQTRKVVYSPGYVVPQHTITYVEQNPGPKVSVQSNVQAGMQMPGNAQLAPVPQSHVYSYAYVNGQPVLVDNRTNTVVWVKG